MVKKIVLKVYLDLFIKSRIEGKVRCVSILIERFRIKDVF